MTPKEWEGEFQEVGIDEALEKLEAALDTIPSAEEMKERLTQVTEEITNDLLARGVRPGAGLVSYYLDTPKRPSRSN